MHHEFGIVTGQVCLGCHVHYVLGCASGGANELLGLFIGREPMRLDGLKFAGGSREDFAFPSTKDWAQSNLGHEGRLLPRRKCPGSRSRVVR
jgi:hypothetical protein